jgi:hypothetical protein
VFIKHHKKAVTREAESLTAMTAKGIRARIIEKKRALALTMIFIGVSLRWTVGAM